MKWANHKRDAVEHYRWAISSGFSHLDLLAAIGDPSPPDEPDAEYVLFRLAEASLRLEKMRRRMA